MAAKGIGAQVTCTVVLLGALITGSTVSSAHAAICDPATDVQFNGHCYYLDGSGGSCDPDYVLASQSVLFSIASQFAGKTYKHQVSNNCCIFNSDPVENWGMADHCNEPGPFDSNEPALGGAGCTGLTEHASQQLTLCESTFTVGVVSAPLLSGGTTLVVAALLVVAGVWSVTRRSSAAS